MSSITHNLSFYKPITEDKLILKKIVSEGFGITPKTNEECTIHYYSETEDGKYLDNSVILKEPYSFTLGKYSVIPGWEICVKSMKMGEKATFCIGPEYSYLALEKIDKLTPEVKPSLGINEIKFVLDKEYTKEDREKMDEKESKKYQKIFYEVEWIKFHKQRPKRIALQPWDSIKMSEIIKEDGNAWFKQKRYREAIVYYKDAWEYLKQIPNDYLNNNFTLWHNSIIWNISNCHINWLEYNYALTSLESTVFWKDKEPKALYFKALCNMHLGNFDVADEQFSKLLVLSPHDDNVKRAYSEYKKDQNKWKSKQKESYKKGWLNKNWYSEMAGLEKNKLPLFDGNNTCFYMDIVVNNEHMYPYKIKFELFSNTKLRLPTVYDYINKVIKEKTLINTDLWFDYTKEEKWFTLIPLIEGVKEEEYTANEYIPNEDVLWVLVKENDQTSSLKVSCSKISDTLLEGVIVIGRCYYSHEALNRLYTRKQQGKLSITNMGITHNY